MKGEGDYVILRTTEVGPSAGWVEAARHRDAPVARNALKNLRRDARERGFGSRLRYRLVMELEGEG